MTTPTSYASLRAELKTIAAEISLHIDDSSRRCKALLSNKNVRVSDQSLSYVKHHFDRIRLLATRAVALCDTYSSADITELLIARARCKALEANLRVR